MAGKYSLPVLNSSIKGAETCCIIHGEPIVANCGLSECAFSTTYPGVKNCILVYLNKHKVDNLSTLDLSMLLGIPHKTIIEDTSKALALLRQNSIETTSTYDIDPAFVVLHDLSVCAVCDSPYEKAYQEINGLGYCSSICYAAKPLQVLALEASCGVDIRSIILWAITKYVTVSTLEEALGLPFKVLDDLSRQLFGVPVVDLYTCTTKVSTPSLSKRVGRAPAWLAALSEVTAIVQEKMVDKYGSVTVNLSSLQQEFENLV